MYKTKDLYLAAYLLASDIPLRSHTREGSNTEFAFIESNVLDKAVEAYSAFTAIVNPIVYANAIRTLKSIVLTNQSQNGNTHQSPIRKGSLAFACR
jgi:hypothetical protein